MAKRWVPQPGDRVTWPGLREFLLNYQVPDVGTVLSLYSVDVWIGTLPFHTLTLTETNVRHHVEEVLAAGCYKESVPVRWDDGVIRFAPTKELLPLETPTELVLKGEQLHVRPK